MHFGAMNFPVTPVLQEIEVFARLGFDYLELAMDPPMAHHSTISANRAAIVKSLQDNKMGLVCHLPTFVSTADLTESIRQASITEMRRSMEVAADLEARKIVLHPSMARGMGAFVLDTVHGYAMDFLSEMVSLAETLDLTLCLENMFPFNGIGVELDDFEKWLQRFPGLMLTLDTGHANIDDRRGKRLKGFLDRFGRRIGHFHLSDNRGKRDDHLAVGQGTVKFAVLVDRIKALGYDDTITLEVFDADRRMLVKSRERIEALLTTP
ncbi:xylose isomerase [Desulfosarcina widdelii]|uniref:Xylose isomerase n=1 Tax=Desulfosarcina widdelii TaxID=947919 RepID=A0A5K7Z7A1_9BACT|nr:sugar phosphate isomerase/epimerase [Desulfosarcina widdelii]BBO76595.1 xylose isomerase [Desulfosarcina widdelii]